MLTSLRASSQRLLTGLLVVGGLLAGRSAAAQWTVQNSGLPTSAGISNISIVDANNVWATGYDGTVTSTTPPTAYNLYTRTTNGGTTWTPGAVTPAAAYSLVNVGAASSLVAWAACYNQGGTGYGGFLYYTADGGTTWTRQLSTGFPAASNGFLNGVLAFNTTTAVAVGDPRTGATVFEMYTTTDAGANWTAAVTSAPLSGEYGFAGTLVTVPGTNAAARSCWMTTNKGRVLRSADSGKNWTAVATGLPAVTSVAFCSPTAGIAVNNSTGTTASTNIAYTLDGGLTWQTRTPNGPIYSSTICGVPGLSNAFVSAGVNPVTLATGSSYSLDGGLTWVAIDAGVAHYTVAFLNPTTGWSGGFAASPTSQGMFKGTLPASALATTPALAAADVTIYPNPATGAFAVQVPAVAGATQVEAQLSNTLGQEVARQTMALPATGAQLHFGTTTLAPGIYTLRVLAGAASVTRKVSIQ